MAVHVKKTWIDDSKTEMEVYVNADVKLFIAIGPEEDLAKDGPYNACIVLDRSDLDELINHLMDLKDEVFDESDLVGEATAG